MIRRNALGLVRNRLAAFDSVALLGPRQVGKTTLAQEIREAAENGAVYLDLESPGDREKLVEPEAFFSANSQRLIVLDEIQHTPEIFQVLRGQIDARRREGNHRGKFLLLGSASMDLLRQTAESLAGRISYVSLSTVTLSEALSENAGFGEVGEAAGLGTLGSDPPEVISAVGVNSQTKVEAILDTLWLRGGFPRSYLSDDEGVSLRWRRDFIRTYLERDIPNFGLKVAVEEMDLFWRLLANSQGELFSAHRYSQDVGVKGQTITKYLEILERLLLVRRLQPWLRNPRKRLVRSPRPYIRDSGILHALLNLRSMDDLLNHDIKGKSWEGFVIESLIDSSGDGAQPFFYRTEGGAEADLVLEFSPTRRWAIEVKLSTSPTVDKGFHNAADDLKAERRILVHKGPEPFEMNGGVEAFPLLLAMTEIRRAVGEEL